MNKSEYIRKIDELGRIVIPKDVRKKLNIQENENIVIKCDAKNIFISKYSYLLNYNTFINSIINLTTEMFGCNVEISNNETIIYSNYQGKIANSIVISEIINDSVTIGYVKLFSETKDIFFNKLCKYIARIIEIYITYSCN